MAEPEAPPIGWQKKGFNPWLTMSPEERLAAERHMMAQTPPEGWGDMPIDDERHPLAGGMKATAPQNVYEDYLREMEGGLEKNVVNPLGAAGYPNVAGTLGALGGTAIEMIPGPDEGLPFLGSGLGMAAKIPKVVDLGAFRDTGKIQGRKGRPPKQSPYEPMMGVDIRSARVPPKDDPYGRMRYLYRDNKDMNKALDDLEIMGYDEPYVGNSGTSWGPRAQGDLPQILPVKNITAEDLKGHLGKEVAEGGSDPFTYSDSKYGITKKLLQDSYNKKMTISTRSDLIAHDDYMDAINPDMHKIKIHVLSDNDRLTRLAETGNPSLLRRIKAAEKLLKNGYDVTIVHDQLKNMPDKFNSISASEGLGKLFKMGAKFETNKVKGGPSKEFFKKLGME